MVVDVSEMGLGSVVAEAVTKDVIGMTNEGGSEETSNKSETSVSPGTF